MIVFCGESVEWSQCDKFCVCEQIPGFNFLNNHKHKCKFFCVFLKQHNTKYFAINTLHSCLHSMYGIIAFSISQHYIQAISLFYQCLFHCFYLMSTNNVGVFKCPLNIYCADLMIENITIFFSGCSNETDARLSISINLWYSVMSNMLWTVNKKQIGKQKHNDNCKCKCMIWIYP